MTHSYRIHFFHFIWSTKTLIATEGSNQGLWIHKTYPALAEFAWQEGYGSFSVSYSVLNAVKNYIQNQKQHHATMTFDEEYLKFLKLHNRPLA